MKKFLLLMGFVVMTSSFLMAQYTIQGSVTDNNGGVLPGAVVRVANKVAIANVDGRYTVEGLDRGNYLLRVSFIGYETFSKEVTLSSNLVLDVVLNEMSILKGEVTVAAIRARRTDPVAYTELSAEEIQKNNFGQDLPYLLSLTPGMVVSSDAGTGIGYTGMRLRGTDITRINVTVNGIPLNDAESQGVFWVNMPDFATSVSQVQIQRGVGTSTNGAASFGGSVNFSTLDGPGTQQVVIDNGFGSFNTMRNSVQVQSGLLQNKYAFDVRLSNITSDGFVDRALSDLKSFYFSAGYFGNASTLRFVTFSGKERTYQAWNGVPKVKLDNDVAGMEKLVAMDGWSAPEAENLYNSNPRTFNRYLYDNQTDNYQQDHYQLHYSNKPASNLLLNASLHYTRGEGYYESYKYRERFTKYNFPIGSVEIDGVTYNRTDVIARKWLDNHFYGVTASVVLQQGILHLVAGGAWNRYEGDHFGNVIWSAINAGVPANYRWYQNDGTKEDLNYYGKASVGLAPGFTTYADLQVRHVSYDIRGVHDNQRDLTRSTSYGFFNPKFGINYEIGQGKRVYASVAVANREPSRSDFRDADDEVVPQPERLINYEAGIDWFGEKWGVQLNGFYMDYKDQLVLTGRINNVGAYIMNNVPKSYRSGIELAGQAVILPRLLWGGNVVLSTNKIKNFFEFVDDWSTGEQVVNFLGTTDIAFSPNVTAASRFELLPMDNFTIALNSRYVGKQFIDNTSNSARQLDGYLVNDLVLRYKINSKRMPAIELGAQINNLLDEKYISNAWVYSYIYDGDRDVLDGYFPQAGRHFMGQVILRF